MALHDPCPALAADPFADWTLENVTACGPRLSLTCSHDDCSSLAGWTKTSGADAVAEFGRVRLDGACLYDTGLTVAAGANFQLRLDFDATTIPSDGGGSGSYVLIRVDFADGKFVEGAISGAGVGLNCNGASTGSSSNPASRFGTIYLNRNGTGFNTWFSNNAAPGTITGNVGANGTLAVTGVGRVSVGASVTSGSLRVHLDNLRNGHPLATAGTATSPVIDTWTGVRRFGWWAPTAPAGSTGTVTVEYRAGATAAECQAAAYQAATAFAALTPSSANRHVQLRVTFAGASLTANSVEVLAPFVDCDALLGAAPDLYHRTAAMLLRHTDPSSYAIGIQQAPATGSDGTYYWTRALTGYGSMAAAGVTTVASEGTTVDPRETIVAGLDAALSNFTGFRATVDVGTMAPGLLRAGSALLGHASLTAGMKAAWTAAAQAGLAEAVNPANGHAYKLLTRAVLDALADADPGNWAEYADADFEADWALLDAQYHGGGLWNDAVNAGTEGKELNNYSGGSVVALDLLREVRPAYRADEAEARVRAHAANLRRVLTADGQTWQSGRSMSLVGTLSATLLEAAARRGAAFGAWAGAASRAMAKVFCDVYHFGFDTAQAGYGRGGVADQFTTATGLSVALCDVAGRLAALVTDGTVSSGLDFSGPGDYRTAWAWDALAGGFAADESERVYSQSLGNYWSHSYINAHNVRAVFDATQGTAAVPNHGVVNWRFSSGGFSILVPSAARATACGDAALVWRSGTLWELIGALTDRGVAASDVAVLIGRHVVVTSFADLGATAPGMSGITTSGTAVPNGDATLSNTTAAGDVAYGERDAVTPPRDAIGPLSAYMRRLESTTAETPSVTASASHRMDAQNGTLAFAAGAIPTAPDQYLAHHHTVRRGAMTPAAETARIPDYSRAGDVITFTFDAAWNVRVSHTPEVATGTPVGSWAVAGTMRGFVGKSDGSQGGGDGLTALLYSGSPVLASTTAARVGFKKVDASTTVVTWDGVGDLRLFAASLPAGANTVNLIDWDGSEVPLSVDVLPGELIVVPAALVTTYADRDGMVELAVTAEPPAAPTSLAATGGDGQVVLTWTDPADPWVESVTIKRALDDEGEPVWVNIDTVTAGVGTYTDNTTINGVEYLYAVSATNSSGVESADSASVSVVSNPPLPTNVVADPGDGEVVLTWTDPAWGSLLEIHVHRYQGDIYTPEPPDAVVAPGVQTVTIAGLTNGEVYNFKLEAVDADGATSGLTATVSATPGVGDLAPAGGGIVIEQLPGPSRMQVFMYRWESNTFCFDFSKEGAVQGDSPATLTDPEVEYVGGPFAGAPSIGSPVVITEDFQNTKSRVPRKVASGKGVAVRITGVGATVAGNYPIRCNVVADQDVLTVTAILVVSPDPEG